MVCSSFKSCRFVNIDVWAFSLQLIVRCWRVAGLLALLLETWNVAKIAILFPVALRIKTMSQAIFDLDQQLKI